MSVHIPAIVIFLMSMSAAILTIYVADYLTK